MSINESSEKESDLVKQKLAVEMKEAVKSSNSEHLNKLQEEIMKGFKSYFDGLNANIQKELNEQEIQQTKKKNSLDSKLAKIAEIKTRIIMRLKTQRKEKEFKIDLIHKLNGFSCLAYNVIRKKQKNKRNALYYNLVLKNKIKKIWTVFKNLSIYVPTEKYTQKMKEESLKKFNDFEANQNQQKAELIKLISLAKEKLKHENRKKIQVKLMLDQMILRGISSLNMQAISLSQNSLTGILFFLFLFRCC